jgi:phage anti-repressor protein
MIELHNKNGATVVNSVDLYKTIGYAPGKYSRWLTIHFYGYAQKEMDYYDCVAQEKKYTSAPKHPKEYWLTIDFAVSICLIAKTESAKKLKIYLQGLK